MNTTDQIKDVASPPSFAPAGDAGLRKLAAQTAENTGG